jgi:hypothetical protein
LRDSDHCKAAAYQPEHDCLVSQSDIDRIRLGWRKEPRQPTGMDNLPARLRWFYLEEKKGPSVGLPTATSANHRAKLTKSAVTLPRRRCLRDQSRSRL